MHRYLLLSLIALFCVRAFAADLGNHNDSNWLIEETTGTVAMSTASPLDPHLQFAVLKHHRMCDGDELSLKWSSDNPAVWSLAEKQLTFTGRFGDTYLDLPMKVVSIRELPGQQFELTLGQLKVNDAVIGLIGDSTQLTLSLNSDDPTVRSLVQETQARFELTNFLPARDAASALCHRHSSVTTAEAMPRTAADQWTLEDQTRGALTSIAGQGNAAHRFGILKHTNNCARDEFFLSWTSTDKRIWSLAEQRVNVTATIDGIDLVMPLQVIAIREPATRLFSVTMANLKPNLSVISLLGKSATADLALSAEEPATAAIFSGARERFSLTGFLTARAQAQRRCEVTAALAAAN